MKRSERDTMEEGSPLESDVSSELSQHSDSSDSDDDRRKAAGSAPQPAATVPPLDHTEAKPAEAVELEPVPEILETAPHGRRPRRSPTSPVARNTEPQDNGSVPSPAASSSRGRPKSVTMEVDEEANLGQGRKSTLGRGKAKSSEPVEIEDSEDGAASGRAGHQKVARHQYARLSSALHTAEEKPDYDPNTVTGSPASPVVYFEAGDMKSMGFKLFSILPEESRSRLTNLLPEYEREKLKASSVLADKAAVNETLRGLVEKFRAIQLRDRAAGDKRGAYSAEDAPTPEYDEDADKAALDAYRRFAAEHADTPVPPEALRKLFESNLFLQTDFDIWRNEIAVGHMAPAFLAGFEKWAEEKEHTTSQKDQHFEAWWGEKADRTKLVAGASREITLLMLIKRKLVLAGDRLVFRRNFSLIKKEIERTVEIERVDAASGVTIRMLPGREGQEGSASSAGSRIEKLDAPTAIEHAILDADGRVGREQRPNGNAWKCLKLLRRDGGGTWIDLGTLWHVRLDEWERKTGQVNSREAAAAAKDGNSTRNKGKGK